MEFCRKQIIAIEALPLIGGGVLCTLLTHSANCESINLLLQLINFDAPVYNPPWLARGVELHTS